MEGKKLKFPQDVVSAITGSIAIIPDGMASAVMAKLNPVNGVYSAVVGLMVGSWTTNSVFMSITTTSALALATGSAVANIPEESKIAAVVALSLMVGIIQACMGILKLGFLVRFVSNAVMRGFLTGVAVLIVVSQIADLTGDYNKTYKHKVLNSFDILMHPYDWNYYTLAVAALTVIIIIIIERTKLDDYAIFAALVVVVIVIYLIDLPSVQVVGDENKIPTTLPKFIFPDFYAALGLIPSAIAISLIGFVQSVGVSHSISNPSGEYPHDSKDLLGQGITNAACGVATGFPVGGSLAQSALMVKAGAKSRWANFLSGLFAGVLVILLSKYIELLPMACFASILILTGISSVKVPEIQLVWNTSWQSRLVMLFTFVITLIVSIQLAVLISVIATFVLHIFRSSHMVYVKGIVFENGEFAEIDIPNQLQPRTIMTIQPYGNLFFAGAQVLRDKLPDTKLANRSVVIIGLRGRREIGSSFIKVIIKYSEYLTNKNSKLILVGVHKNVLKQLHRTGLFNTIGEEDIYEESALIGESIEKAWKDANDWINEKK